jgi:1-deoxy-D-xylulose-5-phosphate reductoisomerase
MAGELMTRAARASGAELLPVDSEHNALHQCLRGEKRSEVRRIVLTASGGPFRTKSKSQMQEASVSDAMRHPTWNMGAKITIDSATLMNKGLEVIEAHWLFDFGPDQIGILVHPESAVHSMIELIDGSVIAQMGVTDMRHAIQYALTYPERHSCELPPLDLTALGSLHFEAPDLDRFPCIALAYSALEAGGTMPTVLNAANEEAVKAFIGEQICLTDIPRIIEKVMAQHSPRPALDLETVLDADHAARLSACCEIEKLTKPSDLLAEHKV